jgi:hypothetical protein
MENYKSFYVFFCPMDRKLNYHITETILSYLNWFLKTIETGRIQEQQYLRCLLEQCSASQMGEKPLSVKCCLLYIVTQTGKMCDLLII